MLAGFTNQMPIDGPALLEQPCDVLVPAALERVITADNAARLRCRILAEGANGPTTPDADTVLDERGDVFVIPDILCNSGGVIVSYFEWVQDLQRLFWTEDEVNNRLRAPAGRRVQRGARPRPGATDVQPHGGDGDRRGKGARRQAAPGPVSVTPRHDTSSARKQDRRPRAIPIVSIIKLSKPLHGSVRTPLISTGPSAAANSTRP